MGRTTLWLLATIISARSSWRDATQVLQEDSTVEESSPLANASSQPQAESFIDVLSHVPGVHWKQAELNHPRDANDAAAHPSAVAFGGRAKAADAKEIKTSLKASVPLIQYSVNTAKKADKVNPLNIQDAGGIFGNADPSRETTSLGKALGLMIVGCIGAQIVALILYYFVGPEPDEHGILQSGVKSGSHFDDSNKLAVTDFQAGGKLRGGRPVYQSKDEGGGDEKHTEKKTMRDSQVARMVITNPWMALSDSLHMYVHYENIANIYTPTC